MNHIDLLTLRSSALMTEHWSVAHARLIESIHLPRMGAVAAMLKGWLQYADQHHAQFQSKIGDDYVLGDAWAELGLTIHRLLDGDCGALDCGTASHAIYESLKLQGFDEDGSRLK